MRWASFVEMNDADAPESSRKNALTLLIAACQCVSLAVGCSLSLTALHSALDDAMLLKSSVCVGI